MFVAVSRMLAPPSMRVQFEAYIERSLHEEIDRVAEYYGERGGGFWVAVDGDALLGMFGLEPAGPGELELRRMCVAPQANAAASQDTCCNSPKTSVGDAVCACWC